MNIVYLENSPPEKSTRKVQPPKSLDRRRLTVRRQLVRPRDENDADNEESEAEESDEAEDIVQIPSPLQLGEGES